MGAPKKIANLGAQASCLRVASTRQLGSGSVMPAGCRRSQGANQCL